MEEEFNLSECIDDIECRSCGKFMATNWIHMSNVKEFIKRIEKEVIIGNPHSRQMMIKLKKLAGSKLVENEK